MRALALLPLLLLLALIVGSLASLLGQIDLAMLAALLRDPEIRFALGLSLSTALLSLALACLIALPAAWAMVRVPLPGKRWLNLLLDLPMVTPPLVTGIGLLLLLGHQGPLGGWLPGLAQRLFSPLGIVIAQTYVATAILLRSAGAALASIDRAWLETAHNLGLAPLATFLLVEIPLVWRALVSGAVLALSRALGEFGATLMLAGATRMKTETLPIAVYLNIAGGDFSAAVGCALLLILLALALLLLLHSVRPPKEKGTYAAY
ncbi:ABC transporter permease [Edwardsiella anguillarum]|uniref:ABC transporter permease n=1 Tax=Edwardsiella anguillarum TaxID=1821960 RepID=UPI0024B637DE|nr:ABC transporter permease [Edwardsiella anguillarum]WHP81167.1 ABC transporter permease [Edwardsiella anguillarum]WHQ18668.1 ABC transporter permease [Edwardsiella anguillarum]WHQ22210.1 ABC transporter permease [Edwardsiella anguillarum]WHQ25733.1 ABC transporter permease [Edwardsiella anguillarum]WHQ29255.1 ABC transporter permease [Edwardsiella anguillarum]